MNCEIRRWKPNDAKELAEAVNNINVQNNLRDGLPFPYKESDALSYINEMLSSDENNVFAFAIIFAGRVVGSIGAFRQSNIHCRTAEMGYYVAEPFWRQGIGTSAVRQLVNYIFENTDIIRIYAEPFACNTGSCRILEKNGFAYEGTLRQNAVKNGNVIDMKMYSIVKKEMQ